jgi:DNA polymerase III sliding clamp (beta) subunit (PCNA family)
MEFSSGVKPIVLHGKNDTKYIHIIMPLSKWL